ncbi:hypothetical protein [Microbacterium indicum]|uniref:hypothetical protein n=1 Tax=Microbacterium indicum TaxID=358100 RepID=UPI0012EBC770|nr:hypothetical protein [Microbacterium indicum]
MRRVAVFLALPLLLVGCAAEAEPEPAWTEEEAYAAAEEVFREFHDAWLSEEDGYGSDGAYLEYLTGELRAAEEESLASGAPEIRGQSVITDLTTADFDLVGETATVNVTACQDDSDVRVVDDEGAEEPVRADPVYEIDAVVTSVDGQMLIAELTENAGTGC